MSLRFTRESVNLETRFDEHLCRDSEFRRFASTSVQNRWRKVTVRNDMDSRTLVVFGGFLIRMNLANFIHLDTSLDPELVNQKQVFINRKERFIKFDTKDNELEVELGISIPFIKVPLTASRDMSDGKNESKVSVNAPGLIVAGMLMLTSFIIVPLLFTTTTENSFGFQRKGKRDIWSVMEGVNEALAKKGIDSSSCMQKSVCWIAKASNGGKDGSIGKWINYLTKTWWFNRLVGGTIIEKAMNVSSDKTSCAAKYSHCSFTKKHLESFVQMVAMGHT